jgi:hypothetical protein
MATRDDQDIIAGLVSTRRARRIETYEVLISRLRSRDSERERSSLAMVLLRCGLTDPSPLIRQQVVEALGELGSRRDEFSLRLLLSDPDELVRSEAIIALSTITKKRVRQYALQMLREDSSVIVKSYAAMALQDNLHVEDIVEVRKLLGKYGKRPDVQLAYALFLAGDRRDLAEYLKEDDFKDELAVFHAIEIVMELSGRRMDRLTRSTVTDWVGRLRRSRGLSEAVRKQAQALIGGGWPG